MDILEGESLVNDATGLLALKFGIALVVSGVTPTLGGGLIEITYLTGAGLLLGLLVGVVVAWVHEHIDDSQIEITLSILVPYTVYLSAEAIRCSGVIAVIACGLYLSRRSSQFFSPDVRMQAWAVWDSLTFILNGLVFVLIGLQLPFVLAGIREYSLRQLVLYGSMFSAILIALRLVWIFPGAFIAAAVRKRLLHQAMERPSSRQIFVVGWTGMRGVLALAAAISLPENLADGTPFPQRNLIIFMTFSVILVTLVLQGLTLPALIRALGLAGTSGHHTEEETARKKMIEAALAVLKKGRERDGAEFAGVYEDLERRYRRRLTKLTGEDDKEFGANPAAYERYVEVSRELLRAERQAAVDLRDEGRINDEVLRKVERELDLTERRLELIQSN